MEENLISFNLQLHAEGDAPVADVTSETVNIDTTVVEPEVSPESSTSNDFDFALDEHGNIILGEDKDELPPAVEDETIVDGADPVVPEVTFYTPEEIDQIGITNLDPSRINPEFIPFYNKFITHQTELQTQLNMLNKSKEELPPAPVEEKPAQSQREYYQQVFDIAKAKVEANLEESFDEFNPLHITALSDEVASIKNYVIQTQAQQTQVTNLVGQYSSDPEWNNIQSFAKQSLDNMPYSQSATIRQKLDSGDVGFLGQFLAVAKEEYYKAKNPTPVVPVKPPFNITTKPAIKPPVLESAGSGIIPPATQTFNYKSLSKMTNDQLADTFINLGLTKI